MVAKIAKIAKIATLATLAKIPPRKFKIPHSKLKIKKMPRGLPQGISLT